MERISESDKPHMEDVAEEYLPTLHPRGKWSTAQPQLRVGDLVWILRDFTARGIWPLGRITATHTGRHRVVRVCTVKTSIGPPLRCLAFLPRDGSLRNATHHFFSIVATRPFFFAAKGGAYH